MVPATPKIIEIVADAGPGGAPTHVRDLILGLNKHQSTYQITLMSPPGWLTEQVGSVAHVVPVHFPNAWSKALQRELADAIQNLWDNPATPPLIHLHGVRAGIAGRLAIQARWPKNPPPVIYTEHLWTKDYHLASRLREFAQLRLLRSLDRVTTTTVAVSQAVADFLISKKITTSEKIVVIPNGVAIPEFRSKNSEVRIKHAQRNEKNHSEFVIRHSSLPNKISYRIGSIGTLVPLKGYHTLIEAMPLILQNLPQTVLEIVGDGPEMHHLSELVRRLDLTDHVRLLGTGNKLNLTEKLASWDIFISTSQSESFGLAIAEAMAVGLPVIATAVGGVPELVTPKTGRLIAPGDPHELAKAVVDLLPQENLRLELGRHAQARIRDHFNLDQMVAKTIDLYTKNLNS